MNTTRYRRHADVRLTDVGGEGVVLHLGERRYFSLNETGLTLLGALAEPRTLPELVASLCEEYEVTAVEAESTARAFLEQCLAAAVVVVSEP
ncbi:MAG: PqqD family protein [Gemmatimonadota bacterium]|nr:PqqD family protein [Gemmatimonadota bacterium]